MTTVSIALNLTGIVNGVAALILSLITRGRVQALERELTAAPEPR